MSFSTASIGGSRQVRGLFLFLGLVWLVWMLSGWILSGDNQSLVMTGMGIGVAVVTLLILKDWRSGFSLFVLWLLFEDLVRKYMGNNMILYFGKDALAAVTYLSLFLAIRRRQADWYRPAFFTPLAVFFGLAFVQVFNPYTPSFLYGILGLKLYFYYAPLFFVGYALVRSGDDLQRFFLYNVVIGIFIAAVGIIQSIAGLDFMNPAHLAPELEELGALTRYSPVTNQAVLVPDSVFVSGSRFGAYLIILIVMAMGVQAYMVLTKRPKAIYGFAAVAAALVAAMQSGSRGCIIYAGGSVAVILASFYWGSNADAQQRKRLMKAARKLILAGVVGMALMFLIFPAEMGAHWAFYYETLNPNSSGYEFQNRAWDYPIENFEKALDHEHPYLGRGTGTASLGMQYVSGLVGKGALTADVENGYGDILVEMGILGPILWVAWTLTFLLSAWKAVKQLRGTAYFPTGFAILWFSFILLGPLTFGGLGAYQDFIMNAYFWILAGVLFRLPQLARAKQPVPQPARAPRAVPVPAMARAAES